MSDTKNWMNVVIKNPDPSEMGPDVYMCMPSNEPPIDLVMSLDRRAREFVEDFEEEYDVKIDDPDARRLFMEAHKTMVKVAAEARSTRGVLNKDTPASQSAPEPAVASVPEATGSVPAPPTPTHTYPEDHTWVFAYGLVTLFERENGVKIEGVEKRNSLGSRYVALLKSSKDWNAVMDVIVCEAKALKEDPQKIPQDIVRQLQGDVATLQKRVEALETELHGPLTP